MTDWDALQGLCQGGYTLVPNKLLSNLRQRGHTPTACMVFVELLAYVKPDGFVFPTEQTLADSLGIGIATVQRAVKALRKDGMIAVTKEAVAGQKYKRNVYSLIGLSTIDAFEIQQTVEMAAVAPGNDGNYCQKDGVPNPKNHPSKRWEDYPSKRWVSSTNVSSNPSPPSGDDGPPLLVSDSEPSTEPPLGKPRKLVLSLGDLRDSVLAEGKPSAFVDYWKMLHERMLGFPSGLSKSKATYGILKRVREKFRSNADTLAAFYVVMDLYHRKIPLFDGGDVRPPSLSMFTNESVFARVNEYLYSGEDYLRVLATLLSTEFRGMYDAALEAYGEETLKKLVRFFDVGKEGGN